jgi:aspartate 1-decarboxylase
MLRRFLFSKIRDLQITRTNLEYQGSITLDRAFLEKSGILPGEEVDVVNLENGSRLTTYTIAAKRGSHVAELNGPAARCGCVGDRIMVLAYCSLNPEEIMKHKPKVFSAHPGKRSTR